ncbi:MAG TPA: hypothetical protein VFH95_15170 [Candidatus Kapabacteria bacterium]|nr:hypothetical protein [Candidatus Kapabacteria bacterium]
MRFILDSFALVVLFLRQKGWERVSQHLPDAADGHYSHMMSAINYGEVYYSIIRAEGDRYAEAALADISEMPIEIIDPTRAHVLAAARLKSKGQDCVCGLFCGRPRARTWVICADGRSRIQEGRAAGCVGRMVTAE